MKNKLPKIGKLWKIRGALPLFRKVDPKSCKNYHTITLRGTVVKIH